MSEIFSSVNNTLFEIDVSSIISIKIIYVLFPSSFNNNNIFILRIKSDMTVD